MVLSGGSVLALGAAALRSYPLALPWLILVLLTQHGPVAPCGNEMAAPVGKAAVMWVMGVAQYWAAWTVHQSTPFVGLAYLAKTGCEVCFWLWMSWSRGVWTPMLAPTRQKSVQPVTDTETESPVAAFRPFFLPAFSTMACCRRGVGLLALPLLVLLPYPVELIVALKSMISPVPVL